MILFDTCTDLFDILCIYIDIHIVLILSQKIISKSLNRMTNCGNYQMNVKGEDLIYINSMTRINIKAAS